MISLWRSKKASRVVRGGGETETETKRSKLIIPNHFRCPISLDTMKDPVTMSTGITYDRESIEKWIEKGNVTCPVTNQVLRTLEPVPNHTIRKMIQDWCVDNWAYGVERIPTPRFPINSVEVGRILEKISMTRAPLECKDLVGKVTRLMKESERNKRCILENGVGRTLASTFYSFAEGEGEGENVISLLEEVMGGLTFMLPLDYDTKGHLMSARSVERLVWFMQRGSLSGRINATLILKELISNSRGQSKVVETLIASDGAMEGLVKLIKEPICASSTKASLVLIYHMITSTTHDPSNQSMIVEKFVNMGLASLILDILVDAEKSICEKSLGVLEAICQCKVGRDAAYNNALTVPIVVKKILRVSDLATEFSVSILWRLCDNEMRESEGVVVDALQVGAFQKLLLVLQVGWNVNERIKDKVTKLLKVLNLHRGKVECIESTDFENLKRSF